MAEGKVSGYKMYQNHDGTWYVEDENENVVLRNASKGEAEHAVWSGNKKLEQGVAEGLAKQFEIIYREQNGDRKRKIVSGTSKEAVARQFKKQYKLEIEQVKQLQQGVAEGFREAPGMHGDEYADKVMFEIGGSESTADAALDAVWSRFKHDIEFADEGSEVMVIARKHWGKVQELAQDAGGWAEDVGGERHYK